MDTGSMSHIGRYTLSVGITKDNNTTIPAGIINKDGTGE